MDIIGDTIESNYSDLSVLYGQLEQINWDRMFQESKVEKSIKRQKKNSDQSIKLTDDEKNFLSLQKGLVLLGVAINNRDELKDHVLKIKIDSLNYDELITNIKWSDHEKGIKFLLDLHRLCKSVFESLYETDSRYTKWTIRSNTKRLFYEMMKEKLLKGQFPDVSDHKLLNIAEELENSVILYTVLMSSEVMSRSGNLSLISWSDDLVKGIYFSKANCILSSLINAKYSSELFMMLINGEIVPIEMGFMKRSQLLSKRFEDLEMQRLKIYEESGLTMDDEDYTKYNSTVRCPKCKLFHTSYSQLQTRSADEPCTIFFYCHKCKIRGRQ